MVLSSETAATTPTFPLDDLTYDLVRLVHETSRDLSVLDLYLKDATAAGNRDVYELLLQMRHNEAEWIKRLQSHLERQLREYTPTFWSEPW